MERNLGIETALLHKELGVNFNGYCEVDTSFLTEEKQIDENKSFSAKKQVPKVFQNTALVTNTKSVRQSSRELRSILFAIRKISGEIKTVEELINEQPRTRVSMCGNALNMNGKNNIFLTYSKHNKRANIEGVLKCGSIWRCPVCSYKITRQRQIELYRLFLSAQSVGVKMSFITLTVRHKEKDSLKSTLDILNGEFLKMQRSRSFKPLRAKYFGLCKALEITYSKRNGWHPHLHLLYFHEANVTEEDQRYFGNELITQFWERKKVQNRGTRKDKQDFKIVTSDNGIAEYISKWDSSKEMATGNFKTSLKTKKGGYTPFSLLLAFKYKVKGYDFSTVYKLFSEYAGVTKGVHHLRFNQGLKDFGRLFDINVKTENQILNEKSNISDLLLEIPTQLWRKLYHRNQVLKMLDLIERTKDKNEAQERLFYYLKDLGYNVKRQVVSDTLDNGKERYSYTKIGFYEDLYLLPKHLKIKRERELKEFETVNL